MVSRQQHYMKLVISGGGFQLYYLASEVNIFSLKTLFFLRLQLIRVLMLSACFLFCFMMVDVSPGKYVVVEVAHRST